MADEISDDFNRADNLSLGANWNEFNEHGTGLRISSNVVRCSRESSSQYSNGWAFYKTILDGESIIFESYIYLRAANTNNNIHIALRSQSISNINNCYYLQFDGSNLNSKLTRRKDGSPSTLHESNTLIIPYDSFIKLTWKITNQTGKVTHDLYKDDVLKYTYDDLSADRYTDPGYVGFYCRADESSAGYIAKMDWFTAGQSGPAPYATNLLQKNKISGFHSFLNAYIGAKNTEKEPLKLPDGTVF